MFEPSPSSLTSSLCRSKVGNIYMHSTRKLYLFMVSQKRLTTSKCLFGPHINGLQIALFPGSTQLFVACSTTWRKVYRYALAQSTYQYAELNRAPNNKILMLHCFWYRSCWVLPSCLHLPSLWTLHWMYRLVWSHHSCSSQYGKTSVRKSLCTFLHQN